MSVRVLVSTAVAVALGGCAGSGSSPATTSAPPTTPAPSPTPTLLAAGPNCRQKVPGTISFEDAKRGLALKISTAKPKVRTRSFSSYARGPSNGYFLSLEVTITNIGGNAYQLDPTTFVFTTSGGRKLTVNSGNAPISGASRVLTPTYLFAGTTAQGPLIYDTPQTSGRISLVQSGKTACTWLV